MILAQFIALEQMVKLSGKKIFIKNIIKKYIKIYPLQSVMT